jgi:hypothetical protein
MYYVVVDPRTVKPFPLTAPPHEVQEGEEVFWVGVSKNYEKTIKQAITTHEPGTFSEWLKSEFDPEDYDRFIISPREVSGYELDEDGNPSGIGEERTVLAIQKFNQSIDQWLETEEGDDGEIYYGGPMPLKVIFLTQEGPLPEGVVSNKRINDYIREWIDLGHPVQTRLRGRKHGSTRPKKPKVPQKLLSSLATLEQEGLDRLTTLLEQLLSNQSDS